MKQYFEHQISSNSPVTQDMINSWKENNRFLDLIHQIIPEVTKMVYFFCISTSKPLEVLSCFDFQIQKLNERYQFEKYNDTKTMPYLREK